ncbi:polymerase III polypeptide H [Epithele typhae]|uniref:polymerase III polypeptide H n=1 Tax=Epithele typhae TaxID=378194 RepID=UPI002007D712|nr:polymerase III polypeptide H [Epithele typhae]KAH9912405.1 polymerase III polypeptide H [Epithele typhae]
MPNVKPTGHSSCTSGTVRLPPEQAITNTLNEVHARRVLHGVGPCTRVIDLAELRQGKVEVRLPILCVFRPSGSEVILAKVKSSDEDGVRLTVGFFGDIYVPLVYLPDPRAFDPEERAQFRLPGLEATCLSHELLELPLTDRICINAGDVLRVRVEADGFHDDELGLPKTREGIQQAREMRRSLYAVTNRDLARGGTLASKQRTMADM